MAQLYVVIWDDAHGNTAMFEAKDVDHKPYRFKSVGLLIRTDNIGVSMAREIGEDGSFRDHEFIPRAMIIDEWSLGELKKKPKRRLARAEKLQTENIVTETQKAS